MQIWGILYVFLMLAHSRWFLGFCQMDRSLFSATLFQQRLLATSSILSCSCLRSSFVLSHPAWCVFQLIGGPERIQYPPGLRILSTSARYSPSKGNLRTSTKSVRFLPKDNLKSRKDTQWIKWKRYEVLTMCMPRNQTARAMCHIKCPRWVRQPVLPHHTDDGRDTSFQCELHLSFVRVSWRK